MRVIFLALVLAILVPPAWAQGAPDIDVPADSECLVNEICTITASVSVSGASLSSISWEKESGGPISWKENDAATTMFTPRALGEYVIKIIATDSDGRTSSKRVTVTVVETFANDPPTADAGADVQVEIGEEVMLDGSGSTDPEGEALTYSWMAVDNESVTITNADKAQATFTPEEGGEYLFRLTVTDSEEQTGSDTVRVTVPAPEPEEPPSAEEPPPAEEPVAQEPTLQVTEEVTATVGASVELTSSAEDADGEVVSYSWSQTSGPAVELTGADTATPGFTPTQTGTYVFEVTALDDQDNRSAPSTVTVQVGEEAAEPLAAPTGEGSAESLSLDVTHLGAFILGGVAGAIGLLFLLRFHFGRKMRKIYQVLKED